MSPTSHVPRWHSTAGVGRRRVHDPFDYIMKYEGRAQTLYREARKHGGKIYLRLYRSAGSLLLKPR